MICLVLPWPPSLNRYYRAVNNRVLISKEGRIYRQIVERMLLGVPTITSRCSVCIQAYPPDRRKRDLDNIQKAALDALQHGGAIQDDGLIDSIVVDRMPATKPGRLYVTITERREP